MLAEVEHVCSRETQSETTIDCCPVALKTKQNYNNNKDVSLLQTESHVRIFMKFTDPFKL